MSQTLQIRRVVVFLAFAFGIAWAGALAIALTGGLANSMVIEPVTRITLAVLLLPTVYMWAPALAHILTRLATREPWRDLYLWPRIRRGWPFWLIAWIAPAILTILGALLYFAVFPGQYDPALGTLKALMARNPALGNINPWTIVLLQTVQAILIAPPINALFTFGEEFGWRGYLLQHLMPLGGRRASLVIGVIWGIWHWPLIAMGYEYGFDYWGFPWLGFVLFLGFTMSFAVFLAWLTLRGRSVWPAVIGHAAINGIAALPALFARGDPNGLLGPLPIGAVAMIPSALLALAILLSGRALAAADPLAQDA